MIWDSGVQRLPEERLEVQVEMLLPWQTEQGWSVSQSLGTISTAGFIAAW